MGKPSKGESSSSKRKQAKDSSGSPAKRRKSSSQETVTASTTAEKKTYPKLVDKNDGVGETIPGEIEFTAPLPTRNKKGQLVFADTPEFQPTMTPKEVLQAGSFGGTYFRPIKSGITGKSYTGVWKELPKDWLEGLDIGKQVSSATYRESVNKYGAKCGGSLEMWEESGWMHKQDPYGWFQWYCRFYQGRRTPDDDRQVGRWLRCAGLTGRWRNNLISKCVKSGCAFDNFGISPVVRQTLQHWAYTLNQEDFQVYAKKMKKKGQA